MEINLRLLLLCATAWLLAGMPLQAADPNPEPPRDIPLAEAPWEKLSDRDVSPYGAKVLELEAAKWKHAETPNYVLHFRRMTEARKVARELEFNLWFTAKTLGFPPEKYKRKGHAFIFENSDDWTLFLTLTDLPMWSGSLAIGDELFLDVRSQLGTRKFNSGTVAHEATHAVIARLYGEERPWPLWLNEGFAEYMAAAGVAARKNHTVGRHQAQLLYATLNPRKLAKIAGYPRDEMELAAFYQSGERLVRFLMTELPPDRFPKFVDQILDGKDLVAAAMAVYPEKIPSEEAFDKLYQKFKP